MKLQLADGHDLAYEHVEGEGPGILFLPGFNSNMQGDKACYLDQWCRRHGRQYTRFDYLGHGQSSGRFEDGTIGRWSDDALAILDSVTTGPQLLVGSSMGGWIMLLLALRRAERLVGLVGIAPAPDFTSALRDQGLTAQQRLQLQRSGACLIENCYDDGEPYPITRALLEEGDRHCLLDRDAIAIDLPVRILHGQRDPDVPWDRSLLLAEKLRSPDVIVQLVKDGDHRLSRPADLVQLSTTLAALLGMPA